MRVAVVFDTPYSGWDHPEQECQMERDIANAAAKAGMEYDDFIQRIVEAAISRYERS